MLEETTTQSASNICLDFEACRACRTSLALISPQATTHATKMSTMMINVLKWRAGQSGSQHHLEGTHILLIASLEMCS
jgi:hypothetical protein